MAFKNVGKYTNTLENEREERYKIDVQMQVDSLSGQFRFNFKTREINQSIEQL